RVCLGLAGASVLFKIGLFASGAAWFTVYMHTFARLHGLAAGAAIAIWISRGGAKEVPGWLRRIGPVAGVALAVEIILRSAEVTSYDTHSFLLNLTAVPFFSWAFVTLVLAGPEVKLRRAMENKPLQVLGR